MESFNAGVGVGRHDLTHRKQLAQPAGAFCVRCLVFIPVRHFWIWVLAGTLFGCGDSGSEGPEGGVGSPARQSDCLRLDSMSHFQGRICGIADCQEDVGCPSGSAWRRPYGTQKKKKLCFLICTDKLQCNMHA